MYWDNVVYGDRRHSCDRRHDRRYDHKKCDCDCHELFKGIHRNAIVTVFLKGGSTISNVRFVEICCDTVLLYNPSGPTTIKICCDDVIAVTTV